MQSTVRPSPLSCLSRSKRRSWCETSSADAGSSSSSSCASCISAWARTTSCFSPPESSVKRRSASSPTPRRASVCAGSAHDAASLPRQYAPISTTSRTARSKSRSKCCGTSATSRAMSRRLYLAVGTPLTSTSPRGRPQQAVDQVDERRLAAAVGPDDADEVAVLELERDPPQHGARVVGEGHVTEGDARHQALRPRRSRYTNSGAPTKVVTTPTGISLGAMTRTREQVGDAQQRRAGQQRDRQQAAMAGSDDQAHDVRHHEAHEADDAADRHGDRGEHAGGDEQQALGALDLDAELERALLTLQHDVHLAREEQRHDHERHRHEGDLHLSPAAPREAAHEPVDDGAHVLIALDHEHGDHGAGEVRDRHAGEQQHEDVDAPAPARRHPHDAEGGEAADEREHRRPGQAGPVQDDADGGAQRRARRHAGDVRVGERVEEEVLEDDAGHRQLRADQAGEEHARHADLPEDGVLEVAGDRPRDHEVPELAE